jgi:hypothetical protein
MGKLEQYYCDLCGKNIHEARAKLIYHMPYHFDDIDSIETNTDPSSNINLCEECAVKIRDFCKTLDEVNGFVH